MRFFRRFPLMNEAGAEGGDGGGAGGATTAAVDPAATTAAAPAGSALAAGQTATTEATGTTAAPSDFVPDKFRVMKEDGSLDLEASTRKLAESYTNLEKVRPAPAEIPKASTDYTVTVPDALKDTIDLENDDMYKSVRDKLHAAGLTQKQFDAVMGEYFNIAPMLAGAGQELDTSGAEAALKESWKDDATYKTNIKLAASGATKMGELIGMSFADLEATGLANNPTFIKIAAALAPEFAEDKQAAGTTGALQSAETVESMLASDAYKNDKHPQHKQTVERVRAYFNRVHGNTAVV